jgi:hypothetical protein
VISGTAQLGVPEYPLHENEKYFFQLSGAKSGIVLEGRINVTLYKIMDHYCPEFSERTIPKYLTYNGFSTILGGVGLKLVAVCPTLFGGGSADERRKDAVLAADGLPTMEHIHADRRALSW